MKMNGVYWCLPFTLVLGLVSGQHFRQWNEEVKVTEINAILNEDPFVTVFYAYEHVKSDEHRRFNVNFAHAKEYLKDFLCTLVVVNCYSSDEEKRSCPPATNSENVYFYRKGNLVVDVSLDSMFSKDAIIANILHLVLLHEVPILQNQAELNNLMSKNSGKKNIVFARLMAVGIPADRVFIETAFAFSSTHQFAMTTLNSDLVGDSEWTDGENKIWFLKCASVEPSTYPCPFIPYRNTLTLEGLVLFLKNVGLSNLIELSPDSETGFSIVGLDTVYISTDSDHHAETWEMTSKLAEDFTGFIGFVHTNRDKIKSGEIKLDVELPDCDSVCLFIQKEEGFTSLTEEVKYDNAWAYLSVYINDKLRETGEINDDMEIQASIYVTEQEVQDDPVQKAVYKLQQTRKLNTSATEELTDKTFVEFVGRDELSMVIFTVKWNPRCTAFLESYSQLGLVLKQESGYSHNPLARVECFDWPDVCDLNNVTAYPRIKVFRNSELVGDYQGPLQSSRVLKYFYLQNTSSPIQLKTATDLEFFLGGGLPEWASVALEGVVLGVFPGTSLSEKMAFEEASKELQGQFLFGVCTGECIQHAEKDFEVTGSFAAVVKWHDQHQPEVVYQQEFTPLNLAKFVQESSQLVLPELTPQSLPRLMQKSPMLVVLFFKDSDLSEEAEEKLGQVALQEEFRHAAMSWIDVSSSKAKPIVKNFLTDEQINSSVPNIVIINRQVKSLCHYEQKIFSVDLLTEWLRGALGDGVGCTVGLKHREWKPLVPGYDFLTLIKEAGEKVISQGEKVRLRSHTTSYGEEVEAHHIDYVKEEVSQVKENIHTEI